MKLFLQMLILTCLILGGGSTTWASSLPRYPEDDWEALSKILNDKTIPVTWKDSHGNSIVDFHMKYGSEDTAVNYLKRATLQELSLIKAGDLLNAAAWYGSQQIVQVLLNRGVSPNPKMPFISAPLMSASSRGNLEIMRMLIRAKADVMARSKYGRDALFIALEMGQFRALNLLLDNGVNLEWYKKSGNNGAIIFTAINGKSKDVVNLLLRNGFNPNVFNELDETPLVHAIRRNAGINIIVLLLNSGADECLPTRDGKLPREVVAELSDIEEPWKREYVHIFKKECQIKPE
ncbi:ankyrin repeat domain-containing protein [Undibacterium umbellatum]|uniref:Ankyrin repeat domain-containing protein n=1 Tax=Undibacterium umbellatum TaxID=2762300 RepID=A0ABR6ZFT7_9BURK|nr:ankyrin repeat domain-containing protein [Undibacterium umbellatum]MBC3910587.1 ankyrin repeat domain-containing protein [Undibacterium umbellatum]